MGSGKFVNVTGQVKRVVCYTLLGTIILMLTGLMLIAIALVSRVGCSYSHHYHASCRM